MFGSGYILESISMGGIWLVAYLGGFKGGGGNSQHNVFLERTI